MPKALTGVVLDAEVLKAHTEGQPLRVADLPELISQATNYMNLKEPLSAEQKAIIADFLLSEFPTLTTDDVMIAIKRAASGKLGIDTEHYNNLSVFYWGKILGAYSDYLRKQNAAEYKTRSEEYYLSPKEFVESGTQAKVHALLEELASKKTAWKNNWTPPKEKTLEEELRQRLITQWNYARVQWAKEGDGRKIQDFPTSMEKWVEDRL